MKNSKILAYKKSAQKFLSKSKLKEKIFLSIEARNWSFFSSLRSRFFAAANIEYRAEYEINFADFFLLPSLSRIEKSCGNYLPLIKDKDNRIDDVGEEEEIEKFVQWNMFWVRCCARIFMHFFLLWNFVALWIGVTWGKVCQVWHNCKKLKFLKIDEKKTASFKN